MRTSTIQETEEKEDDLEETAEGGEGLEGSDEGGDGLREGSDEGGEEQREGSDDGGCDTSVVVQLDRPQFELSPKTVSALCCNTEPE